MSTLIVCGIVVVIVGLILRKMLHNSKSKDCGGSCGNCKGCH